MSAFGQKRTLNLGKSLLPSNGADQARLFAVAWIRLVGWFFHGFKPCTRFVNVKERLRSPTSIGRDSGNERQGVIVRTMDKGNPETTHFFRKFLPYKKVSIVPVLDTCSRPSMSTLLTPSFWQNSITSFLFLLLSSSVIGPVHW